MSYLKRTVDRMGMRRRGIDEMDEEERVLQLVIDALNGMDKDDLIDMLLEVHEGVLSEFYDYIQMKMRKR